MVTVPLSGLMTVGFDVTVSKIVIKLVETQLNT